MKKYLLFTMMACLLSTAITAQEWISFGSKAVGTPPETIPCYQID